MRVDELYQIKKYVEQAYASGSDPQHDLNHVNRVWQNARDIVLILKLEKEINWYLLEAICYVHDLTYANRKLNLFTYFFESRLLIKTLNKMFKKISLQSEDRELITETVQKHMFSFPFRKLNFKRSIYAKILQDADTFDYFNDGRMKSFFSTNANWLNLKTIKYLLKKIYQNGKINIFKYLNYPQLSYLMSMKKIEEGVHYQTWGKPNKPVILALPGYADSSDKFAKLGKILEKDYYLVSVNYPMFFPENVFERG